MEHLKASLSICQETTQTDLRESSIQHKIHHSTTRYAYVNPSQGPSDGRACNMQAVTSPCMMAAAHEDAAEERHIVSTLSLAAWPRHVLASRAERARVAREPGHDAAQLVWPSDPAQRIQARPLVQQVRLRVNICCGHAGSRNGQFPSDACDTSLKIRRRADGL